MSEPPYDYRKSPLYRKPGPKPKDPNKVVPDRHARAKEIRGEPPPEPRKPKEQSSAKTSTTGTPDYLDSEGYVKGTDYQCMDCKRVHHGPDAGYNPGKDLPMHGGGRHGEDVSHGLCPECDERRHQEHLQRVKEKYPNMDQRSQE